MTHRPAHTRVCLAMTVRDAVTTLPRLAASLDGVIDEWFVVDAGSTDGTVELVHELFGHLPGVLQEAHWEDTRANAEQLLKAVSRLSTPTHILLMEQDSVAEASPSFRDELAAEDAQCLMLMVRRRLFEHRQPLLLRVGPEWTYGEQGYLRLRATAPVATADFDGLRVIYFDDREDREEVLDENVKLLLEQLSTTPESSDLAFEVALHYRDLGRWEDALAAFRETLAIGADRDVTFYCIYQIAEMHFFAGRNAEAAWSYMEAMQIDPSRIESFHRLGRLLNSQARWEAALVWLERGAGLDRGHRGLFPETWVSAWGVDFELAIARWWTGAQETANSVFEALLHRPDLPQPYRDACENNLALGGPQR